MSMRIRAALWVSGLATTSSGTAASSTTRCLGASFGAIAGSFDDKLVGSVGQTVQRAIAEDRVVEQPQSFVNASV
jgi:hypothetical protein